MSDNKNVTIGVWVYAEPSRLQQTVESIQKYTPAPFKLVLLPDGPDTTTATALAHFKDFAQLATDRVFGAPACFNRLISYDQADVAVFLESGSLVTPGWLESLLAGLSADPGHGLAGPSTNRAWNEQGAFPSGGDTLADVAHTAQEARQRFGSTWRTLEPLHSLADFCYVVRREVIQAVGAADERYGCGPCWEMDYNVRAARAGFRGVWACGAYVHRLPLPSRRIREETRLIEVNKKRYQDKFCGLKLEGQTNEYHPHCKGDACQYFAPKSFIQIQLPLRPEKSNSQATAQRTLVRESPQPFLLSDSQRSNAQSQNSVLESADCPLVSCIMPTHNRRSFVAQSIAYFLRQDYPNRELIIIDDGTDPIRDLVPTDPRIRYVRQEKKNTVGAKRNVACTEARGTIIVHWDDDDWMAPWRLRYQVENLLKEQADVCGIDQVLYYAPQSKQAWRYIYPKRERPWVVGGTLCYTKAFWQKNPFPDINVGEDTRFVWRGLPKKIVSLQDPNFYVALIHSRNSSPKRTADSRWHPYPVEHLQALIGSDLAFYDPNSEQYHHVHTHISDDSPLVSCIMPTYNRRLFVPQAITYFLRQDYPNKELVIVDDGTDTITDLIPTDERIRYIRLDQQFSVGRKRNIAVEQSRGKVIAHWDDDDWYHPSYLREVTQHLLQTRDQNAVAGLSSYSVYILEEAALKICQTQGIAGATLCYGKSLWEQHPYRDVASAEDYFFLQDAKPHVLRLDKPALFIVVRHTQHTWNQERGADVNRLLHRLKNHSKQLDDIVEGEDACFYASARSQLYPGGEGVAPYVSMAKTPLVSCIMPTYNRRLFVPQAIQYFLRQDYPNKELIVVDDGSDSVADLMPDHASIRYIRLDQQISIGAKRNMAVEQSQGEMIVHWDDDDWYAPNRIRYQVEPLLEKKAEVCGLKTGFIYDLLNNTFWACDAELHAMMFYADIHGGSIAYAREVWEKYNKFPHCSLGEDAAFLRAVSNKVRIAKYPNQNVFIYLRHNANAWEFICGNFIKPRAWKQIPPPSFLGKDDLGFYLNMSSKLLR